MSKSAELLQKAYAELDKLNIVQKAPGTMTLADDNFGQLLPTKFQEEIISLTRSQSEWLGAITTKRRTKRAGSYPVMDLSEPVSELVPEVSSKEVTTKSTTRQVQYATRKMKAEFYISTEELMESVESGIGDLEQRMIKEFATAIGNDVADVVINGDMSLNDATKVNRLRRSADGLIKQLNAGANVNNAAGKAWGAGIWFAMLNMLPERFAADPNLQWMFSRVTNSAWHNSLSGVSQPTVTRSGLGDRVIAEQQNIRPLGIPQLVIPQMSSSKGATSVAPTAVADGSNGVLTVRVHSLLDDGTSAAGRKVRVTHITSGISEVLTVTRNGSSQNIVSTSSYMGFGSADTTASHYLITEADLTDLVFGNPQGIHLIYTMDMRSYREFNPKTDQVEITTYYFMDVKVPTPEIFVLNKNVQVSASLSW